MDYNLIRNVRRCAVCGATPNVEVEHRIDSVLQAYKIECSCGCTSVCGSDLVSVAERWDRANDSARSYLDKHINNAYRHALNSVYGWNPGRGNGKTMRTISEHLNNIARYDPVTRAFEIDKVIFNDPATIVFWKDGTKTVVKAENEPFDQEKGLAMAISKKALGNKYNYFNVFKKWLKKCKNDNANYNITPLNDEVAELKFDIDSRTIIMKGALDDE